MQCEMTERTAAHSWLQATRTRRRGRGGELLAEGTWRWNWPIAAFESVKMWRWEEQGTEETASKIAHTSERVDECSPEGKRTRQEKPSSRKKADAPAARSERGVSIENEGSVGLKREPSMSAMRGRGALGVKRKSETMSKGQSTVSTRSTAGAWKEKRESKRRKWLLHPGRPQQNVGEKEEKTIQKTEGMGV